MKSRFSTPFVQEQEVQESHLQQVSCSTLSILELQAQLQMLILLSGLLKTFILAVDSSGSMVSLELQQICSTFNILSPARIWMLIAHEFKTVWLLELSTQVPTEKLFSTYSCIPGTAKTQFPFPSKSRYSLATLSL